MILHAQLFTFLPFTFYSGFAGFRAMRSKQSRYVSWKHGEAGASPAVAIHFNTREAAGFLVGSHKPDYAGSAERSESDA